MANPAHGLIGAIAALLITAAPGAAVPIAVWDFDDATPGDQTGNGFDLVAVGDGAKTGKSVARFDGDDVSPSFLEATGSGAAGQYTLSLWVRALGTVDQGAAQGIFSNSDSSSASVSWQIESSSGVYHWRNQAGTFAIGASSGVGRWDHLAVRKFGGSDGDVWFNGVRVVASLGGNPGGLQMFRLGTNRDTNQLYRMDLDDVRVYDSVEDPGVLFAAGMMVPAPGRSAATVLAWICLGALLARGLQARPARVRAPRP